MMRRRTTSRPLLIGGALLALGAIEGCGLIFDFDYSAGSTSTTGGGGGSAPSSASATSSGEGGGTSNAGSTASGAGGGCVDTMNDAANCGKCGWDCLGGTCTKGECSAVVVVQGDVGTDNFNHLALDKDTVYWGNNGRILSVPLDAPAGMEPKASLELGVDSLAVDANNLYWAVFTPGQSTAINVAPKATPDSFTHLAMTELQPLGLSVGDAVYWSQYNVGGAIRTIPIGGGSATDLVPVADRVQFTQPAGSDLYWTHRGNVDAEGGVKKLVANQIIDVATKQNAPTGLALDATYAYWVCQDGSVLRALRDPASQPPVPLSLGTSDEMSLYAEIAVDTDLVYWGGLHTVWSMKKNGADTPRNFGGKTWTLVRSIKTSGRFVYWTTGPDAQLMRKAKRAVP